MNSYSLISLVLGDETQDNNIYIVWDTATRDAVIIDPAWDAAAIESAIGEHDLHVVAVLVTHSHSDHVSALAAVTSGRSVPILISAYEAARISLPDARCVRPGHETDVRFGSIEVKSYHTPGHTPGSFCYLIGDRLFSGDTLFIEGCGDCTLAESSVEQMWNSVQFLKDEMGDDIEIYPGHQYRMAIGTKFGDARKLNIYLQFKNRDTFIQFAGRQPLKK